MRGTGAQHGCFTDIRGPARMLTWTGECGSRQRGGRQIDGINSIPLLSAPWRPSPCSRSRILAKLLCTRPPSSARTFAQCSHHVLLAQHPQRQSHAGALGPEPALRARNTTLQILRPVPEPPRVRSRGWVKGGGDGWMPPIHSELHYGPLLLSPYMMTRGTVLRH